MLTLSRPAIVLSDLETLGTEYRSARWIHHRLLDFEDEHQRLLDEAAEAAAPGILRVGRILSRLARRAKWAERASPGAWRPRPRPELTEYLQAQLKVLRKIRNADPRWKAAVKWATEQVGEVKKPRRRWAKDPSRVKRKKSESDEAFAKRFERLTTDEKEEDFEERVAKATRKNRRSVYRDDLYAKRNIYWGTWNALCNSVDQARKAVLERRREGLPAEWHHPKYRHPTTLAADKGFRIVHRGGTLSKGQFEPGKGPWWVVEIRLGVKEDDEAEWVRVAAKCGNWHDLNNSTIKKVQLTRRKNNEGWSYSLSLTAEGVVKLMSMGKGKEKREVVRADSGTVAFDWGHREHGHDNARKGIRAFVWHGSDGRTGEILIPIECRRLLDEIDEMKTRIDKMFNARKTAQELPERTRFGYRRRLMLSGVRTEEESNWLRWETRYERRIDRRRKRIKNLRQETYINAVRMLRTSYFNFVFEDERIHDSLQKQYSIRELEKDEQMRHRARANRDLTARYLFTSICERFGAEITKVSRLNTTKKCPHCGRLTENTAELLIACPQCGKVRDKDHGAALTILKRGEEALEDDAAE